MPVSCLAAGGVEVSYVGQKDILRLLEPGTEGYCYIASMVRDV